MTCWANVFVGWLTVDSGTMSLKRWSQIKRQVTYCARIFWGIFMNICNAPFKVEFCSKWSGANWTIMILLLFMKSGNVNIQLAILYKLFSRLWSYDFFTFMSCSNVSSERTLLWVWQAANWASIIFFPLVNTSNVISQSSLNTKGIPTYRARVIFLFFMNNSNVSL